MAAPVGTLVRAAGADAAAGRGWRAAVPLVLLWLLAAGISAFTMLRYLDPFDEGLLLQAASRIADGQWPYADFSWAYGPGHPLLMALLVKLGIAPVLAWRLVRVVVDATIAALVYAIVEREAGPRWALAGGVAAAVTIAQPTTANSAAPALALALGAVAVAVRGRAGGAGAMAAATAFWRPDFGLYAALGALAAARGWRAAVATGGVAAAGTAVLYAPFAVAAGLERLWDGLVAQSLREGGEWRLPFPLSYDGPLRAWPPADLATDLKDLLGYYLPLVTVVGVAACGAAVVVRVWAVRRPRGAAASGPSRQAGARDPAGRRWLPLPASWLGLLLLALGALVYLRSRTDELHVQPLAVVLCALLPLAAAWARRGPLAVALAALLAVILVAGAANRLSALLLPPDLEPVHLDAAPGVRVPPSEARALPRVVALVRRLVPPGEPIYVAPRRSDLVRQTHPLLHVLADRPNVLHRDAFLQARPEEQAGIVAALRRERPRAVVRWTDPASSRAEPNARGRPSGSRALDRYLADAYRLRARFGRYDVLMARGAYPSPP